MNSRIVLNDLKKARCEGKFIKFTINPFIYENGNRPRLPRKSSRGYNLRKDTVLFFNYIFSDVNLTSIWDKFKVSIIINKGCDSLG